MHFIVNDEITDKSLYSLYMWIVEHSYLDDFPTDELLYSFTFSQILIIKSSCVLCHFNLSP